MEKERLVALMKRLASVYTVEVASCAETGNHYHIVLYLSLLGQFPSLLVVEMRCFRQNNESTQYFDRARSQAGNR